MKRFLNRAPLCVAMGIWVALLGSGCTPSPPSENNIQERAVILETPGGLSRFAVTGSTADLGRYLALGEATLVAGQEEGVLLEGTGIAVLQAENGDRIIADVACKVSGEGSDFTFQWRDSVTLSTGSTVSNSGAFVDHHPPELIVSYRPAQSAGAAPEQAVAQERAMIFEKPGEVSHFAVTGTTADFGRYLAIGEATFNAGTEEGVLLDATGTAFVQAEDGDRIVADVTCKIYGDGPDFTFHWRDSVTFSTGSTVSNTGVFVDHRPPGLAVTRTASSALMLDNPCAPLDCGERCEPCNCHVHCGWFAVVNGVPIYNCYWICDTCCRPQ